MIKLHIVIPRKQKRDNLKSRDKNVGRRKAKRRIDLLIKQEVSVKDLLTSCETS